MTEMKVSGLTKYQKRTLFWLADWGKDFGGLGYADGRSAQELIKRRWADACVRVDTGMKGVMACEMRYVITAEGRKAAHELGWRP